MALVQVTLSFKTAGDAPLGDTRVAVQDELQTTTLWSGISSQAGVLTLALEESTTYQLLLSRPLTVYSTPVELAVPAGPDPVEVDVVGAAQTVDPPSSPDVCRVYGYMVAPNLLAISNQVIAVDVIGTPQALAGYLVTPRIELQTDDDGYFFVDLVRGLRVRFSVQGTRIAARVEVPDQASANLATLIESADDEIGNVLVG